MLCMPELINGYDHDRLRRKDHEKQRVVQQNYVLWMLGIHNEATSRRGPLPPGADTPKTETPNPSPNGISCLHIVFGLIFYPSSVHVNWKSDVDALSAT